MNKIANRMLSDRNTDYSFNRNSLFLFLILPITGFIISVTNKEKAWSKNLFWLFCIFFGLTFVIAEEGGADSDRYARLLLTYASSHMSLQELWQSFYSVGSGYLDVVSPLIIFLVSRVTENPVILFAIFGLIFGYFYSRNIWYILERTGDKTTGYVLVLLITFALFNPIWNINGFRFWTAAQIFLYGTLPYLLDRDRKYLPWSVFALFMHFSFFSVVAVLGLFIILGNRLNLFLALFLLSSLVKEIDLQWIQSAISFLPEIFSAKVLNYTNPDYARALRYVEEDLPWFITYSSLLIRWANYMLVLGIVFTDRQTLEGRKDIKTVLSFALLLFAYANVASLVPSGQRFLTVANSFLYVAFILYFATAAKESRMQFIRLATIPVQFLYCVVAIRIGMDFFSIMTLIGNPVSAFLYTDPAPFIVELKNLF